MTSLTRQTNPSNDIYTSSEKGYSPQNIEILCTPAAVFRYCFIFVVFVPNIPDVAHQHSLRSRLYRRAYFKVTPHNASSKLPHFYPSHISHE